MTSSHSAHDLRRAYLLGEISEADGAALESAYFASGESLAAMEAAEEELIEAALEGRLDPAAQAKFERHFLARAPLRRRFELARRLRATAAEPSVRRRPWPRLLRVALLAASVVLGAVLFWRERPSLPSSQSLLLPAVQTRDTGSLPTLTLARGTVQVELRLASDAALPPPPWRATVAAVGGGQAWSGSAAAVPTESADGVRAVVEIPAPALPDGDYFVGLVGATAPPDEVPLARWSFRIVRR